MSATTKKDIDRGLNDPEAAESRYLIVMCDTFSYEDYPVYCKTHKECEDKRKKPGSMQRVMEVIEIKSRAST